MNRYRFWRPLTVMALGSAALCSVLMSAHALESPAIRVADGIEYMSGGKNTAELNFLQMVSPRWAVTLKFAVNQGPQDDFPADVRVSVHDKYTGRSVMETTVSGPLMLARLEAGTYEVQASVGGLTLTQSLDVFEGVSSSALFLWPSNFDFASVMANANQLQAAKKTMPAQVQIKADIAVGVHEKQAASTNQHD